MASEPYKGTSGTSNVFYLSFTTGQLVTVSFPRVTDPGVYQTFIDLSNMTAAHSMTISVHETTTVGEATQDMIYEWPVAGTQSTIWTHPPLTLMNGWDIRILINSGASIPVSWSIRKV